MSKIRDKWLKLYDRLYAIYGDCRCPLVHKTPFQLLVAVVLSAQCRDARVNEVTKELFAIAGDAKKFAQTPLSDIEKIVHPCGLSQSKSKNLLVTAKILVEKYNGEIPNSMLELVELPGVGRKSANVLLGNAFGIPGFPVDTHVKRLLNRIGLVKESSPEKIEAINNKIMPSDRWTNFSHLLIQHGRQVCHAQNPNCEKCAICELCQKKRV